jgi:hypothetical protein
MAHKRKTQILQTLLLLAWITLVFFELTIPVQSQGCFPPLVTPGYLNPINVTWGSWRPAIGNVTVKIDGVFASFTPDATFRIEDGQRKWNSPLTCSGVNFTNFEDVLFTPQDLVNDAPFGEVHWEVDDPGNSFNGAVFAHIGFGARVEAATIKIRPNLVFSNPVYFNYLGSHEIGHTFNLNDCLSTTTPACLSPGLSIMSGHTNTAFDEQGPTGCDFAAVANIYCPSSPSPTPTPTPTPTPPPNNQNECESINWYWNPFADACQQDPPPHCDLLPELCENGIWSFEWCGCVPYNTPIIVDLDNNGFDLTSSAFGVSFNLNNVGGKEKLAWTNAGSDDAWLVLDRNGNGTIDNGTELFGDVTPQPATASGQKNGFRALAEYDKPALGGNGDGEITQTDAVFSRLGLWQDTNHNGLFDSDELRTLAASGINTLELDYWEYKKTDVYGNAFRYRGKLKSVPGKPLGRWAWDVILVRASG